MVFQPAQAGETLRPTEGMFQLTLANAESAHLEFDDVVIETIKRGIPPELITRFVELWSLTKVLGGEVIAIGKIIVKTIIDFLAANPKLTIGLAVGAAISTLIAGIPFIGPVLAPFSTTLSVLYGAGVGASMQNDKYSMSPVSACIELAHKFFEALIDIFNAIASYWTLESSVSHGY